MPEKRFWEIDLNERNKNVAPAIEVLVTVEKHAEPAAEVQSLLQDDSQDIDATEESVTLEESDEQSGIDEIIGTNQDQITDIPVLVFKCNHCNNTFSSELDLENHKSVNHIQSQNKCNICEYEGIEQPSLDDHLLTIHDDNEVHCYLCDDFSGNKQF